MKWIEQTQADLINWWWQNQFDLLFTHSTSDTEAVKICRIVNNTQPIGKRMKPYTDYWQGTLELASINNGSLVF